MLLVVDEGGVEMEWGKGRDRDRGGWGRRRDSHEEEGGSAIVEGEA